LADLVIMVNLEKLVGQLAKLELRLVDAQSSDAMVKRGWWNTEPRRGSRRASDTAPGRSESRFDELPFGTCLTFGGRW
jgi:hypothetical protein